VAEGQRATALLPAVEAVLDLIPPVFLSDLLSHLRRNSLASGKLDHYPPGGSSTVAAG